MDDLAQEIAVIRDELTPEWDDERNDRLFAGVGRTQRRRRIQRLTVASALGAAAAVALVLGVQTLAPRGGTAGELAGRNVRCHDTTPAVSERAAQPVAAVRCRFVPRTGHSRTVPTRAHYAERVSAGDERTTSACGWSRAWRFRVVPTAPASGRRGAVRAQYRNEFDSSVRVQGRVGVTRQFGCTARGPRVRRKGERYGRRDRRPRIDFVVEVRTRFDRSTTRRARASRQ